MRGSIIKFSGLCALLCCLVSCASLEKLVTAPAYAPIEEQLMPVVAPARRIICRKAAVLHRFAVDEDALRRDDAFQAKGDVPRREHAVEGADARLYA